MPRLMSGDSSAFVPLSAPIEEQVASYLRNVDSLVAQGMPESAAAFYREMGPAYLRALNEAIKGGDAEFDDTAHGLSSAIANIIGMFSVTFSDQPTALGIHIMNGLNNSLAHFLAAAESAKTRKAAH